MSGKRVYFEIIPGRISATSACRGRMPFPGHRTVAEVDAERSERKAA